MIAELAKENGDVTAVWERLKEIDLQITEWRGISVFVSAPDGAIGSTLQIGSTP
ncbi:hypothetical protein [Bradyrhizobium elkanii]|uniref:hypothetical protein n=1 Tax=Bradyrhizobium elkanii TaxID=29448 RepID=UPI002FF2A354